jgi:ABC-2 type transport system permease protein
VTVVAHELKASYAFIERNFFLTRRYWGWELAFLVYSVAGALSIALIGVEQGSETLLLSLMWGDLLGTTCRSSSAGSPDDLGQR